MLRHVSEVIGIEKHHIAAKTEAAVIVENGFLPVASQKKHHRPAHLKRLRTVRALLGEAVGRDRQSAPPPELVGVHSGYHPCRSILRQRLRGCAASLDEEVRERAPTGHYTGPRAPDLPTRNSHSANSGIAVLRSTEVYTPLLALSLSPLPFGCPIPQEEQQQGFQPDEAAASSSSSAAPAARGRARDDRRIVDGHGDLVGPRPRRHHRD